MRSELLPGAGSLDAWTAQQGSAGAHAQQMSGRTHKHGSHGHRCDGEAGLAGRMTTDAMARLAWLAAWKAIPQG